MNEEYDQMKQMFKQKVMTKQLIEQKNNESRWRIPKNRNL